MKTYFAALLAAAAAATSAEGGYHNNQHNHSHGYQHGGGYPHAHQTHPAYDPWTNTKNAAVAAKTESWYSPYH